MLDTSYIGQLVAGAFYLIVGVGLLRLAHRTRELPERLLGLYFLFTAIDYNISTIPVALGIDSVYNLTTAIALLAYAVAIRALLLFTRRVFRNTKSWAGWLTGLCTLSMFGGWAGSMAVGKWDGGEPDSFWFWCYFLGYTLACIWISCEAGIAFASARKRQRIGLCSPVVVNRYMLWLAFGAFQVASCVLLFFVEGEVATSNAMVQALDPWLGAVELTSIATVWLAFFPPRFYRR